MKIVIAGGGFGGLRLARKLNNKPGFEVVLVDRFNYHQFQPLFYQVATAGLDASNISFPLRKVFHNSRNVKFRMAEIKEIRPTDRVLVTDKEEISYDRLVLAMGADTNFFGNMGLASEAFSMKSTVEALQIRHRLLQNFEDALRVSDPEELQRLMNIVVVGGGPTGVELSGALAEMKKYVLPKDYPELDFSKMNIFLLEGSERTLATMSQSSSRQSKAYLEKLGVSLLTGTLVKDYDGREVILQNGNRIPSGMVIWAAGIRGNVPKGVMEKDIVRGGRIRVNRYCELEGQPGIYAVGDLAWMETPKYPNGHPQVAQGAIQMADLIAENLKREQKGKTEPKAFEYVDKGSMATVGRNLAVVDLSKPNWHFGGFLAWLVWMGLHLMLILGVKNRLFVFLNWLYNYITYDQNLRLVFREFYRKK